MVSWWKYWLREDKSLVTCEATDTVRINIGVVATLADWRLLSGSWSELRARHFVQIRSAPTAARSSELTLISAVSLSKYGSSYEPRRLTLMGCAKPNIQNDRHGYRFNARSKLQTGTRKVFEREQLAKEHNSRIKPGDLA